MKIYGYSKEEDDLHELVQVTFQAEPDQLRELARFLFEMAEKLEDNRENFGHAHAKDYCKKWPEENPEIIGFKPS